VVGASIAVVDLPVAGIYNVKHVDAQPDIRHHLSIRINGYAVAVFAVDFVYEGVVCGLLEAIPFDAGAIGNFSEPEHPERLNQQILEYSRIVSAINNFG
jgi:hypothetical protein